MAPPRAPFDDKDADIIFRSSDHVDFHLYKVVVAKASPVLRDMITLPTETTAPQVVELTETARTLEHVFRFCGPVAFPDITTVDDIRAVLEAARKYDMAVVVANLRWVIRLILPKETLRVYASAYMYELEDVAREAAVLLLHEPTFHIPSIPPPEFDVLPSFAIYTLHTYRQKCVQAALRVLDDHEWILNGDHERARLATALRSPSSAWCWITDSRAHEVLGHSAQCVQSAVQFKWSSESRGKHPTIYYAQWWWVSYVDTLRQALGSRPSGRTVLAHIGDMSSSECLSQAMSCSRCTPKAYADLSLYNTLLSAKVDAAISEVSAALDLICTSPF